MKINFKNSSVEKIYIPEGFPHFTDGIPTNIIVHFGLWKKELTVEIDPLLPLDTLCISDRSFGSFDTPSDINFEVKFQDRNFYIGPVIGFVPVASDNRLTDDNLDLFKKYMKCYPQINGLVILFAANGIDFDTKTVEGFYYSLNEDKWKKGKFPFPSVVYRKTGFGKKTFDGIVDLLGNNMFNTYFFNKWELWNYVSPYDYLRDYLPETARLTSIDILDEMINKYKSVYLKQINGYKAKGIIKAYKSELGYHFVYRLKGEKIIKEKKDVEEFINEINKEKNYLIQQSIDIKLFEERPFDFRVILQKGKLGSWDCPGIIGRFGKKGSISTNFLLDGFSRNCIDSLKLVFGFSEKEAFQKEQEIIRVCKNICDKLNETVGHYADLGIDVMIDCNQKIWILEVNKLHDHKFPLYGLNDSQMYYKVLSNPIYYAKFLSGF
ncbi:MAG: hypothetical protein K0S34_597 [Bacillales bacterium]|nr:hypothetical protein [Bacillales bacterium]